MTELETISEAPSPDGGVKFYRVSPDEKEAIEEHVAELEKRLHREWTRPISIGDEDWFCTRCDGRDEHTEDCLLSDYDPEEDE